VQQRQWCQCDYGDGASTTKAKKPVQWHGAITTTGTTPAQNMGDDASAMM
jgi:hypothetical protein